MPGPWPGGSEVLVLDHYLELLKLKPGALPGATALARARASGAFVEAHEAFWSAARRRLGDAAGTRALIEVLLAYRYLPAEAMAVGLAAAVATRSVDPEVVIQPLPSSTRRATCPRSRRELVFDRH